MSFVVMPVRRSCPIKYAIVLDWCRRALGAQSDVQAEFNAQLHSRDLVGRH